MNYAIVAAIYFAPMGLANMTPIFMAKLPGFAKLNQRLDFGYELAGEPLLGKNKTWRGLLSAIAVGALAVFAQSKLLQNVPEADYLQDVNILLLGMLSGSGAIIGDAIKSFFKRRFKVAPGAMWFPFDQIDYLIGGIIFTLPLVRFEMQVYLILFLAGIGLHILTNILGYIVGLKSVPY